MITLISTIVVLSTIVFFHEFGHYISAKLSGVGVIQFSLGFPPTILKKRFGETEYAIGAIPFGGYVKLSGESQYDNNAPAPGELGSKSLLTRAIIIFSGPAMNFFLAIFLFWFVVAFHGVGELSSGAIIGGVLVDSPADTAGFREGDSIIAIEGAPIAHWSELANIVHSRAGVLTEFEFVRESEDLKLSITPVAREFETDSGAVVIGLIGIQPVVVFRPMGVFQAIPRSFSIIGEVFNSMCDFITKLFDRGIQQGDIGGPILIAKMAGVSASSGWAAFLFFMAALSINLGILNLLPFPVLDGGHLAFIAIEAIIRKPVPAKVRLALQQVGIILILALMLYVTINDIFTVFGGK